MSISKHDADVVLFRFTVSAWKFSVPFFLLNRQANKLMRGKVVSAGITCHFLDFIPRVQTFCNFIASSGTAFKG